MFVVICQDTDESGVKHWFLPTRRVFTESQAVDYLMTFNPSWHARIVPLEKFVEMLPRHVEVKP